MILIQNIINEMKILVTGANGQIGWELSHYSSVVALNRQQLDLTQPLLAKKVIQQLAPNIIVNAAAYTAVDRAETDKNLVYTVNCLGAKYLAEISAERNIPLIQLSTDYVFNGQHDTPYLETDQPNPVNYYGESKWLGEQAVISTASQYIILRVSSVFSTHGHNFVKTILNLAKEREELQIINDQWMCPTSAKNIAKIIIDICQQLSCFNNWGIYHYCGNSAVSWFEFSRTIINIVNQYQTLAVKKITPITTAEYPLPAQRPAYSTLNCHKIKKAFGIEPCNWKDELSFMLHKR